MSAKKTPERDWHKEPNAETRARFEADLETLLELRGALAPHYYTDLPARDRAAQQEIAVARYAAALERFKTWGGLL